ncbi:unnamed protein product, partial [Oikopleura dioica]
MIMLRLQRVTFLALHDYLGLSEELIDSQAKSSLHRTPSRNSSIKTSVSSDDALNSPNVNSRRRTSSITGRRPRFSEVATVFEVATDDNVSEKTNTATYKQGKNVNNDFNSAIERAFCRDTDDDCHSDAVGSPSTNKETPTKTSKKTSFISFFDEELFEDSVQELADIFGLENSDAIADKLDMAKVEGGTVICDEGDQDPCLYYIVSGCLVAQQRCGDRSATLYEATRGSISGQLSVLTGEPTFFKTTARENSILLKMQKSDFYALMRDYPRVVLNLAATVVSRLSKFVRQIDFALDWVQYEAGQQLFAENEPADCIYIVLSGRLRGVKAEGIVCEFGRGETVGLMDLFRSQYRTLSVHAVRDTEVARIPAALMEHIKRLFPSTIQNIIALMTDQVAINQSHQIMANQQNIFNKETYGGLANQLANVSTVAVLTSDPDVPLEIFSIEVANALNAHGKVQRLASDLVKRRLGERIFEVQNEFRLTTWLGQQEDIHRVTIYQCDEKLTGWTKRCLRQADCILVVALGGSKSKMGSLEHEIENFATRALKVLVLLHNEEAETPHKTAEWLNIRGWLTTHFHIKVPSLMMKKNASRLRKELLEKIREKNESPFSDFSRLARFITGRSVGIVFGGGGARGITQIAFIEQLIAKGIPIDMVGGTSIGSLVGALYAKYRDVDTMNVHMKDFCKRMSSLFTKILDITYPI